MKKTPLPAQLAGVVTRFRGNGRKLGYPTANLAIATGLADGVYFGYADLAGYHHHPAIIFVGTPTTVGDTVRRVEAHLLDARDQDYYDGQLSLSVRHYHRANQTFKDVDELVRTMRDDEQTARAWFGRQT